MREHKAKKHHRSVSPESTDDHLKSKRFKQHRHHHSHLQNKTRERDSKSPKEDLIQAKSSRDQSPDRRRSDRDRDKSNVRDRAAGREKHGVRENDDRSRVQPSSSKWDDDDDDKERIRKEIGNAGRPIKKENERNDSRWRGSGTNGGGGGGLRQKQKKRPFFRREEEDTTNMEWGKKTENGDSKRIPPPDKDKPNFGLSGKLTEDTNTYNGVVIKYSEPPEARKPKRRWRLYPFKGDEALSTLHIHRQSAFLMGRDRKVVDIPIDHPSCSKQHAALQYRLVKYQRDDGSTGKRIRPYIIDLDSANGTYVNNNKIEPRKYVELLERDVIKFGYSSREYVLLHEHSKDDEEDDNM